ncbi:MAG: DUF4126 domain-containing protein [Solirubrobacterales bacterium]|nr:DUF4126 domain-containing protein [Solirubrobacterales bacterium]
MELVPTLFSTGWAAGVNAYASLALLGLLGRAGVGEVPDALESTAVIALAGTMFLVEFVTDKIPYLDNLWDLIHTAVRPAIASVIAVAFSGEASGAEVDEALAAAGSGTTALASHAVKAGLRLGINTSPEPVSNILTSLLEDGLVAVVIVLAVENPVLAAVIAALLLALGIGVVVFLGKRVRRGIARLRERRRGPPRAPS